MALDTSVPFTIEAYARENFPGVNLPLSHVGEAFIRSLLIRQGYRDRGGYWSMKILRAPKKYRISARLVNSPKYIKWPPGEFCITDLLAWNNMTRSRANLDWAQRVIREYNCIGGSSPSRYIRVGKTGNPPPTVTGDWRLPNDSAFTTVQFQRHNEVWNNVTRVQWKAAVEWLESQGFKYNPKWKRWIKAA